MKQRIQTAWRLLDRRILYATLAVIAAVMFAGYVGDKRSCERNDEVRNALQEYAVSAAHARRATADNVEGRDPKQAQIERTAASEFDRSVAGIRDLDCSTIPAGK